MIGINLSKKKKTEYVSIREITKRTIVRDHSHLSKVFFYHQSFFYSAPVILLLLAMD